MQQFIDISRIRHESIKIRTHPTESKVESRSVQILTPAEVKSEISKLIKQVEDAKTDQVIVSAIQLDM
jgi:hypothetical protein